MAPIIIVSFVTCFATLAATYSAFFYSSQHARVIAPAQSIQIKSHDLQTITVPIIRKGQIRGYLTADFSIIGHGEESKSSNQDVDSYVLDEAYRLIYAETDVDFDSIKKADLSRLTSDIRSRVNTRLQQETIQDVLVRGFHYVPRDQLNK